MGAYEVQVAPPPLPGDYNLNGTVDAADYTLWRNTKGQSVAPYAGADGDGSGTVDSDDYLVWRDHYGMTLGTGSGSAEAAVTSESQTVTVEASAPQTVAQEVDPPQQSAVLVDAGPTEAVQADTTAAEVTTARRSLTFVSLARPAPRPHVPRFAHASARTVSTASTHEDVRESIRTRALLEYLAERQGSDAPTGGRHLDGLNLGRESHSDPETDRQPQAEAFDRCFERSSKRGIHHVF